MRTLLDVAALALTGANAAPGAAPDHLVVAVGPGGGDELLIVRRGGTVERRLPVHLTHDPDWRPEPGSGRVETAGPARGSAAAARRRVVRLAPRRYTVPAGDTRRVTLLPPRGLR